MRYPSRVDRVGSRSEELGTSLKVDKNIYPDNNNKNKNNKRTTRVSTPIDLTMGTGIKCDSNFRSKKTKRTVDHTFMLKNNEIR